jgi:cGMP-dependent protein kinase
MNPGEYFGEQALLYNSARTATVTADTEVECLTISREALTTALGSALQQVIYKNSLKIGLERSVIIKMLNKEQVDVIISRM